MKISYNQLKDYIKELPNPKQLAEILTNCGLEVENYEYYSSIPGGLNGIIIAEILDKEKHPNADKLSICKVTDGNNIFNVICGAPNVDKGQKVLFAPIGTNVFRGEEKITIKKISIRGIESEGMICAEDEIGLGNSHYGIVVLPNDVKTGMLASEYFKVYEDTIFEIGLTPNRSDATSYIGVARDIIAVLNLNNYFNNNHNKLSLIIPDVNKFSTKNHDLNIEVEIQNNNCIRYSGVSIKNVKVQDSPKWLKEKLKAIGIRPINNIVDITNFVLFETGQPLHAFDASKIKGNKIIVKSLPSKTNFVTLDGISRELNPEDLMICNESEPMCIAGVFGGIDSGITDNTKDVFLESACFKASSIRKTSKRHSLKTDASFRFERGTDPNITIYALKRAALMICQIAGGYISSEIKDVYPKPIEPIKVFLSYNKLNSIAGTDIINKDIITLILESIQVKILQEQDNGLLLEIPTFKTDVTREIDIIEEILRIYGYNKIPLTGRINASLSNNIENTSEKRKRIIADYLVNNGFTEIMCNSLTSSTLYENNPIFPLNKSVKILNPLSCDLNVLRQTLLYGGLEIILYNQNRKIQDVKLFEFGNVYKIDELPEKENNALNKYKENEVLALFIGGNKHPETWYLPITKVDFFYLKAHVFNILKKLSIEPDKLQKKEYYNKKFFTEGLSLIYKDDTIVELGKIETNITKKFGLKETIFYAEFMWNKIIEIFNNINFKVKDLSKFPEVRRDLALIIHKKIKYSEIEKLAYKIAHPLLKNVSLFDVYEGENIEKDYKSYAIRFILESEEKTLTDEEIETTINKLIQAFEINFNAQLRK